MSPRASAFAFACILALTVSLPSAQAPTVDDLVARNIQAKGGLDKIRSIDTSKQTKQVTFQGAQAAMVLYAKRPNLMRQEIRVGGQTQVAAFDGSVPWTINPMAGMTMPVVLTGPQADAIRDQSDFDGPLIDYKTKGYRIELLGVEMLGGRSVNHLRMTDKNGGVQQYYLDAGTALEAKISSTTGSGTFDQELSDYRDVDGIKVPFSIRTLVNGVVLGEIHVTAVEFNPKLDDALFKIPQQ